MRALRLLGLLLAAGLALPACYETPAPACAFLCGQGGACPDGYTCRADSWCRRQDVPDDAVCSPALSDAATPAPDAPPADAAFDASTADAAARDAAPLDAAPLDAALPDASSPDASPPDAAPPDAATLAGS
jgi:hypothetical protein